MKIVLKLVFAIVSDNQWTGWGSHWYCNYHGFCHDHEKMWQTIMENCDEVSCVLAADHVASIIHIQSLVTDYKAVVDIGYISCCAV